MWPMTIDNISTRLCGMMEAALFGHQESPFVRLDRSDLPSLKHLQEQAMDSEAVTDLRGGTLARMRGQSESWAAGTTAPRVEMRRWQSVSAAGSCTHSRGRTSSCACCWACSTPHILSTPVCDMSKTLSVCMDIKCVSQKRHPCDRYEIW